jgi:hypothetical protein
MPAVGDRVVITCRAKVMAKGFIYESFHDAYNPYFNKTELYATIMIDQIVHDRPHMKGQRRNWTTVECQS